MLFPCSSITPSYPLLVLKIYVIGENIITLLQFTILLPYTKYRNTLLISAYLIVSSLFNLSQRVTTFDPDVLWFQWTYSLNFRATSRVVMFALIGMFRIISDILQTILSIPLFKFLVSGSDTTNFMVISC